MSPSSPHTPPSDETPPGGSSVSLDRGPGRARSVTREQPGRSVSLLSWASSQRNYASIDILASKTRELPDKSAESDVRCTRSGPSGSWSTAFGSTRPARQPAKQPDPVQPGSLPGRRDAANYNSLSFLERHPGQERHPLDQVSALFRCDTHHGPMPSRCVSAFARFSPADSLPGPWPAWDRNTCSSAA